MKKSIVFMFSGQGSQYYQMGRELYEHHPRFKLWMDHCDRIVEPLIGTSLIKEIYKERPKGAVFDQILYTNPALLCIEFSLSRILMEMKIQPDFLLGYSLGEITASVVSGAISLEEGLQLSVDYAKLLEQESPPASMLAVVESVNIMREFPELFKNCWLTGKNFKKNFVVSGLPEDIRNLQIGLSSNGMISQMLPVNYGFHTELIDTLESKFKQLVNNINLSNVRIPIISSISCEEVIEVDENYLWRVTRYPVNFEKTISTMLQKNEFVFIDVGPSGSLATFVKYLLPNNSNSLHLEVINQFGKNLKSIEKLKDNLSESVCT